MKLENIVNKLEKLGHKIDYVKFSHWYFVPRVDKKIILAEQWCENGTQGLISDFKFDDVSNAIEYHAKMLEDYKKMLIFVGDDSFSMGEYFEWRENW